MPDNLRTRASRVRSVTTDLLVAWDVIFVRTFILQLAGCLLFGILCLMYV